VLLFCFKITLETHAGSCGLRWMLHARGLRLSLDWKNMWKHAPAILMVKKKMRRYAS